MIVISGRPGDLGNRLFVFAHFLAFGHEYDVAICDLGLGSYASDFEFLKDDAAPRFPPRSRRIPRQSVPCEALFYLAYRASTLASRIDLARYGIQVVRVDWDESLTLTDASFVALAKRTKLLFAQGWLFDARPLLVKHGEFVRQTLAFERELVDRCLNRIESLRGMSDVIVGVHIRRGDYRIFLGGKYHFPMAVYRRQMARFHELVDKSPQDVAFVLCSDEPLKKSEFDGFSYLHSGGRATEDMCMLSQCDFIFGPPSTFSLWASFAGQVPHGMLITPDHELNIGDFRIAESQMEFPEVEELLL